MFTPTLLTILGVIMYVRIGWVVGNAGLFGALAILTLGLVITACTGLSLSSIATNTRIGAGGPYAIMNRSLGLDIGGSIGIPLYLTRPLGVAMYIFGFREGVQWILGPDLVPALAIDLIIFGLLFGIAYRSADLAFKTQYVIMGIIALSLVSIFAANPDSSHAWEGWGSYPGSVDNDFSGADFWIVFAVFFPATTGILAGANMSGDLADPRRAIPVGTLAAIVVSAIIYYALAVWAAVNIPPDELVKNYNAVIDASVFPPIVLAGLLGATASSALAGLVGGPRILMAMGQNRILPASEWLAEIREGEPRNALAITGVLTLACIAMRDLNAIAPAVTMFFLITYAMINVVVLVEDGLGLVSYRPTLQVPILVPAVGLVGCIFSMFIVSPEFSLISIAVVGVIFAVLHRQGIGEHGEEGVRSSIFANVAEWAANKVSAEDRRSARSWKPNLLVPVEDMEDLRGKFHVLADLASPVGSVHLLGLATVAEPAELDHRLDRAANALITKGVPARYSVVALDDYRNAVSVGMMALQGAFFRPNLLFLAAPEDEDSARTMKQLLVHARLSAVGAAVYASHTRGLGDRAHVRVLVAPSKDFSVEAAFSRGNLNLVLLLGYRLAKVWGGSLSMVTVVDSQAEVSAARALQRELIDLVRLQPKHTECHVEVGTLREACARLGAPDITLVGLPNNEPDAEAIRSFVEMSGSTCLFVRDSGVESARA
ncbi:MAG: Na-K-Cl cotransporter [Deltaproteobacteria bacterium]|nr:MAG: Na-K-Cl cotransporter [Deltaproteobacteria bacterium]